MTEFCVTSMFWKCCIFAASVHSVFIRYLPGVRWRRRWHPTPVTLAWKIPRTEEPGRLQSMGSLRVRHDWATSLSLSCIGEGNGNPLQCCCLENPRDGGAWWAAIYGVAQSRTRLKQLSSSSSRCKRLCWALRLQKWTRYGPLPLNNSNWKLSHTFPLICIVISEVFSCQLWFSWQVSITP